MACASGDGNKLAAEEITGEGSTGGSPRPLTADSPASSSKRTASSMSKSVFGEHSDSAMALGRPFMRGTGSRVEGWVGRQRRVDDGQGAPTGREARRNGGRAGTETARGPRRSARRDAARVTWVARNELDHFRRHMFPISSRTFRGPFYGTRDDKLEVKGTRRQTTRRNAKPRRREMGTTPEDEKPIRRVLDEYIHGVGGAPTKVQV